MASPFTEIEAKLISEGEMLEVLNENLQEAAKALVAYRREHGDRATKAKAGVTLDIELVLVNVADGAYQINWKPRLKLPHRPVDSSFAIEADGEIFIKKSGSDDGDPRQLKLSTGDGRTIDPETHEAIDEDPDGKSQAAGD